MNNSHKSMPRKTYTEGELADSWLHTSATSSPRPSSIRWSRRLRRPGRTSATALRSDKRALAQAFAPWPQTVELAIGLLAAQGYRSRSNTALLPRSGGEPPSASPATPAFGLMAVAQYRSDRSRRRFFP